MKPDLCVMGWEPLQTGELSKTRCSKRRSFIHSYCFSAPVRVKVKLMNISFWKQKTLAHYTSSTTEKTLICQTIQCCHDNDRSTRRHTLRRPETDRDVCLNCGCLRCYSENKRRIWRAKYRNRIMSFLSSASIVSISALLSSSLHLASLLTGPNISLGPLSCIKEIYYTRDFRLYGGSKWKKKKNLQILEEYGTVSSPQAQNTPLCQIMAVHVSR